jgi:hypothetical protein
MFFISNGYIIEVYNTNLSFVSSYNLISSVGKCDDKDKIPDILFLLDNCLFYGNIALANIYFIILGYARL